MATLSPPAARNAAWSIYGTLAVIAAACFVGALLTDITYSRTADMMWADFSAWLLAFGMLMGGFAAIARLIALYGRGGVPLHCDWPQLLLVALILILSLINCFVHSRDAWTSVVPTGLMLSAIVTVLIVVTTLIPRFRKGAAK